MSSTTESAITAGQAGEHRSVRSVWPPAGHTRAAQACGPPGRVTASRPGRRRVHFDGDDEHQRHRTRNPGPDRPGRPDPNATRTIWRYQCRDCDQAALYFDPATGEVTCPDHRNLRRSRLIRYDDDAPAGALVACPF